MPEALARQLLELGVPPAVASAVRVLWRGLAGDVVDAADERVSAIASQWGFGDDTEHLEHLLAIYNDLAAAAATASPKRSRKSQLRNTASQYAPKFENLTAILPVAVAERFPLRTDPKATGPIEHKDKYGRVTCDRTLRPQQLGILAAASGLYANRDYYMDGEHPIVTPDGDIMLSGRKLYWLVVGGADPGGAGLKQVVNALADLSAATMNAEFANPLEGARDRSLPSNPLKAYRIVVGEHGPEWAPIDDERPTATGYKHAYKIVLEDWYKQRIDEDSSGRVAFSMSVWRDLPPFAARLFVWLQAQRAETIAPQGRKPFTGVHLFAGRELCAALGITHHERYSEVRDTMFAALCEIVRSVNRYEWCSKPYRRIRKRGWMHYDFVVRIKPRAIARTTQRASDSGLPGAFERITKAWLRRSAENRAALLAYDFGTSQANGPP